MININQHKDPILILSFLLLHNPSLIAAWITISNCCTKQTKAIKQKNQEKETVIKTPIPLSFMR